MGRRKPSVLIIEDNEFIIELVKKVLKQTGMEIHSVSSIRKGYNAVIRYEPDLIILDRGLPDGDGHALLQQIKTSPRTAHIPVMMLTAENRGGHIENSLGMGADDYVVKPFQNDKFLGRVQKLLRDKIEREKAMMASMLAMQPQPVQG